MRWAGRRKDEEGGRSCTISIYFYTQGKKGIAGKTTVREIKRNKPGHRRGESGTRGNEGTRAKGVFCSSPGLKLVDGMQGYVR